MEYLKKECEALKNKAREAQEKFLSESGRLKAIIREHQGNITLSTVAPSKNHEK